MQNETNLTIRATGKFGNRGQRYEVLLGDEIIAAGTSPEFTAVRVLKDRGIEGKAIFWRAGKPHADFTIGIEWGAGRCVLENAKIGLRFAKWAPNPMMFGKTDGNELEEAA